MNWHTYKKEFEWDGSLRDLYILDTDLSDWQKLIDLFQTGIHQPIFRVNHELAPIPEQVADIFQRRNERSVFMTIDIEGIFLNCHFFTEEEIEFDLDPGEVNGEEKLEQLFKFMQLIGALLQKEVILTPENMQEIAIFSYKPGTGKIEFMPFGGWQ